MTLNELVKLMMLWTTGPRILRYLPLPNAAVNPRSLPCESDENLMNIMLLWLRNIWFVIGCPEREATGTAFISTMLPIYTCTKSAPCSVLKLVNWNIRNGKWIFNTRKLTPAVTFCDLYKLAHDKTYKMTCAPSEILDQPGHLPSLVSLCYALNCKLKAQVFFMQTAKTNQTGRMPRLIWVFAESTGRFVSFVKCWFKYLPLTLSTLGKIFSRRHFEIFFLFFTENRIWHFMQIVSLGDNLHEMSNPVFWEK